MTAPPIRLGLRALVRGHRAARHDSVEPHDASGKRNRELTLEAEKSRFDSTQTVASRIRDFDRAGIETFMLQFQLFEAEMRRFAEPIMPRVDHA